MLKLAWMKNVCLLFMFFGLAPVFGQAYEPLLSNYNEWHLTSCFFGCLTDRYYTAGDTVVDGQDYKVLDGYHYISRTFLLREDVTERKVYLNFVSPSGNTEYLLYDFSMEVGDSIDMKNPITPFPENAGYYTLDAIILEPLVDGIDYRHFYLSPSESNTVSTSDAIWVEGAGSLSMITAPSGFPDINDVGHLSCAFKDSEPFYVNLDSIDDCEPLIVLGVNQYADQLSKVEVSSLVRDGICSLSRIENVRYIDVFDINGRKVLEATNSGKRNAQLDVSIFDSGLYLLIVYTNQFQKKTFKIVVD